MIKGKKQIQKKRQLEIIQYLLSLKIYEKKEEANIIGVMHYQLQGMKVYKAPVNLLTYNKYLNPIIYYVTVF